MTVAACKLMELLAVVVERRTAEEPAGPGKEELKVVVGHSKRWDWNCTQPPATAHVVDLPLSCLLSHSKDCYCIVAPEDLG
jgi:hypothetical protein